MSTTIHARGPQRVPLSPAERADLIDGTRWATDLSWPEIETMAGYMSAATVAKEELLFREGEKDLTLYLVVSGSIDVRKRDSAGQVRTIATVGSGRTLGEMALIDGEPRSASAVAAEDAVVLLLTERAFHDMIQNPPNLGVKLLLKLARLMSQRLRQTSGALVELLHR